MTEQKKKALRLGLFGLLGGLLFAAMTTFGYSLNKRDTIWSPGVFSWTLLLTPLFGAVLAGLFYMLDGRGAVKKEKAQTELGNARCWFLLAWLFLFLAWVPVLLAAWPGIFSYDCGWQLVGFVDGTVSAHHPILHTGLLGICLRAGQTLFGSNNAGAALYSLVQMALMSAMYAYVCLFLRKKLAPEWLQLVTFLFLAFHPTNSLMALCATKDSIFSALFAVFTVELFEMLEAREAFFESRKRQAVFVLTVFLLFAFRNNAFHTFLLSAPFFLLVFRKNGKRMLLLIAVCLGLYLLYTGPVYRALHIEKGDPREMCSVLMQGAARVYNQDNQGLTEEEKEAFLSIIEEEGMNSYLSWFADPVKAYFNGKAFAANPKPFLKAWISAGMRHKKLYIDSFLANTFGYWYPGDSLPETKNGKDYFEYNCKEFREDVDVTFDSKLPALSEFYRGIGNEASFEKLPVIRMTFRLGTYTWLLLFAALLLLYRRQYERLLLVIPLGMYFFTTLLGPVVKMRYHYPLIACAPLLLYLIWMQKQEEHKWTR